MPVMSGKHPLFLPRLCFQRSCFCKWQNSTKLNRNTDLIRTLGSSTQDTIESNPCVPISALNLAAACRNWLHSRISNQEVVGILNVNGCVRTNRRDRINTTCWAHRFISTLTVAVYFNTFFFNLRKKIQTKPQSWSSERPSPLLSLSLSPWQELTM